MIISITMQDLEKGGGDSMSVYVAEMSSRVGYNHYQRGGYVRTFILQYLAPPLSSVWAPFIIKHVCTP
jgi:hypothetical protein